MKKLPTIALLAGAGFGLLAYYYKDLKKSYGWLPDIPDPRDFLFTPDPGVEIQATVNLSSKFPFPPQNQGNLGSCTAQATIGTLEYLETLANMTPIQLSRLFGYYNSRLVLNTVNQDTGATIRDALKAINTYGICPEGDWPYQISQYKQKPSEKAYSDASGHKEIVYERLSSLDEMKSCLSGGFPFVFGFQTYESFESSQVAQSGKLDMPKSGEKIKGGHAVAAVGYDEGTQRFVIRNSWGTSWGMNGYFTMPYTYLDPGSNLASDFWVIRKGY